MRKMCSVSLEEVVSLENLFEAWQEFIRCKRKNKDVQEFMLHLGDEIVNLHFDLISGSYKHGGYTHFRINDPKPRDIHKASVRDRLLHHAIHRKLYPFFSQLFISDSFSCQTGKGLHPALNRFRNCVRKVSLNNTQTCWILKCDIRKFFASIDQQILFGILQSHILDDCLFHLLECVIESFELEPGKGIPLGNLTSQLFANIYMNEFDMYVKHDLKIQNYIRYADDFVILSRDRIELFDCIPKVSEFLSGHLALCLHSNKVFIRTLASGVDFLGWINFPYHRVPRTKMKNRMKRRTIGNPNHQSIQSYLGILSHGNTYELSGDLKNLWWLFSEK